MTQDNSSQTIQRRTSQLECYKPILQRVGTLSCMHKNDKYLEKAKWVQNGSGNMAGNSTPDR